jgi:hypothetical protein
MTPLLKELSSLEVEPLQTVEKKPASEQERSLDRLIVSSLRRGGSFEADALLMGNIPSNSNCGPCCCCCTCTCC